MNLETLLPRSKRRRWWFWPAVAVVAILILILIIVPLAIVLPRKNATPGSSSVILPLYIYPQSNTTWRPVYEAMASRPDLQFTVIVNPNSGPGVQSLPDPHYVQAITQLSSYPNARILGYVRTDYAKRKAADVIGEVVRYAGWAANSSALAVHGIFLDEAPHQYSAEAVDFLREVNAAIKKTNDIQKPKTIVHNPGAIPDSRILDTEPDITVVFEHDFKTWEERRSSLEALPDDRSRYSLMVHSMPSLNDEKLGDFVESITNTARHLFITTNHENFYESFGSDWEGFVRQVPA